LKIEAFLKLKSPEILFSLFSLLKMRSHEGKNSFSTINRIMRGRKLILTERRQRTLP